MYDQDKKVTKKRIFLSIIILAVVICLGYFLYIYVMKKLSPTKPTIPPTMVTVAKAIQQEWYDQIQATGNLSAFQGIIVRSEVPGRITKIYVGSGIYVDKGTPLFQIYPDILEAQLARNLAALKLAELDYERGVTLFRKRVISRQDLDTLTSTLQQDRALVAQTQAQLDQNNIRAPFSGMLGLKLVDIGDYVQQGQDLVPLQQIEPIRAQFSVPEVYLSKLAVGQQVQITPSSNPNKVELGTVYAFDSAINPSTRALSMRAKVPNKDHALIPGGFVSATLYAGTKHMVVTIPQTAVTYSSQGFSVYKVINNIAKQVTIVLGERNNDAVEVKSGVAVGDVVVTAGQVKLSNGAPVKITADENISVKKNKPAPETSAPTTPSTTKN